MKPFVLVCYLLLFCIVSLCHSKSKSPSTPDPKRKPIMVQQKYSAPVLPYDWSDYPSLNSSDVIGDMQVQLQSIECAICVDIMKEVDVILQSKPSQTVITAIAKLVCELIKASGNCPPPLFNWQCHEICSGMISEFSPTVVPLYVMSHLDPEFVCWKYGFKCPKPPPIIDPYPPQSILSDPKQPQTAAAAEAEEEEEEEDDRETAEDEKEDVGYFITVGDIHWDDLYVANAVVNCGEPVCCRASDDEHKYKPPIIRSGVYGSAGNCDASTLVMDSMFAFIKSDAFAAEFPANRVDFAMWVGDGPPHDVWMETQPNKLSILSKITDYFVHAFSNNTDNNIPVFMNLGNHEILPINQYSGPSETSDSWLYGNMSQLWKHWMDNPFTANDSLLPSASFTFGGFYTTLIMPGLRLVVINTGFVQSDNWYLQWTNTSRDIGHQLHWLQNVLQQALLLEEDVYVMQHLPLSHFDDAYLQNAYYKIYQNYSSIIKALFCGHTHEDSFHVLSTVDRDSDHNIQQNAFAVEFNVGAVTTYGGKNPQLRVFEYNRSSHEILDYHQFILNITAANELLSLSLLTDLEFDVDSDTDVDAGADAEANVNPDSSAATASVWTKLYQMTSAFNMNAFAAQDFVDVGRSFADNALFEQYKYFYLGGYLPADKLNQNGSICTVTTATNDEYSLCMKQQQALEDVA